MKCKEIDMKGLKNHIQNCNFYLVALSGDVSAKGMGDVADAILLSKAHYKLIRKFLICQAEYNFDATFLELDENNNEYYYKLIEELFNAKIFTNKYQTRSTWDIVIEGDLDLLGFKYKIIN